MHPDPRDLHLISPCVFPMQMKMTMQMTMIIIRQRKAKPTVSVRKLIYSSIVRKLPSVLGALQEILPLGS